MLRAMDKTLMNNILNFSLRYTYGFEIDLLDVLIYAPEN